MNYLVHLYLSDPSPEYRLGNLMGDFVKGRLDDTWPEGIALGMRQHRRLDTFAHSNEAFRRSKARIDDAYGHCKGVMVDIFYDHFLARNWDRYSPIALEEFARSIYRLIEEHFSILPPALQQVAPRMITHNWLVSYRHKTTIARVLKRISARLTRPNQLDRGTEELHRHYPGFETDCDQFLEDAKNFLSESM